MDSVDSAGRSVDQPDGPDARGPGDAGEAAIEPTGPNPETPREPCAAAEGGTGQPRTRGILWILAGLVVTGAVAGYEWWRRLAR
jgi:hypothetical protein